MVFVRESDHVYIVIDIQLQDIALFTHTATNNIVFFLSFNYSNFKNVMRTFVQNLHNDTEFLGRGEV